MMILLNSPSKVVLLKKFSSFIIDSRMKKGERFGIHIDEIVAISVHKNLPEATSLYDVMIRQAWYLDAGCFIIFSNNL